MKRTLAVGLAGSALFALVPLLLLLGWQDKAFTLNMVLHMASVALAAPLIAIGLAGGPADPARLVAGLNPVTASLLEMLVVWFFHMPAVRTVADGSFPLSLFEQAAFLLAGLLLWSACLTDGSSRGGSLSRLAGVGGLLFTSMHMTLLGVLLALSPRPLYREGWVTCFGLRLDAGSDQHLGGVVMLAVGAVVYLAGGIFLLAGLVEPPAARREDAAP